MRWKAKVAQCPLNVKSFPNLSKPLIRHYDNPPIGPEQQHSIMGYPTPPFKIELNAWLISRIIVCQATNDREIWFLDNGKGLVFMISLDD
jgi:hypothetical protein